MVEERRYAETRFAASAIRANDDDDEATVRARLRLAAHATNAGWWEIDVEAGTVTADRRARELFGVGEHDALDPDGLFARLHDDERSSFHRAVVGLRASETHLCECRVHGDGDRARWTVVGVTTEGLGKSTRRLGIVYDITDRKRAAEEHTRIVDELSKAVHVSELFVGILSHDLRNPLNAIMGGASVLSGTVADESSRRILGRVLSSSERMARMIDQLLDFTRARLGEGIPLHVERADFADLAREAVEEANAAAPGSTVRLTTRGDMVGEWDEDRLAQVVSNLLGNAIQHGAPGRGVHVVVDGSREAEVVVRVRNEGAIPTEILPVVFNAFRGTLQKRDKSKGLGLGLYVARQIAIAHGGDLSVESSETSGTEFTLRLPRSAAAARATRDSSPDDSELLVFDRIATPTTSVTAQIFGAAPLKERVPLEYWGIVDRYAKLLELSVRRQIYRDEGAHVSQDVRRLAERLGELRAGAREVTEIHTQALRRAVAGATIAKTNKLVEEGRLLALELMGNLLSYYRQRASGSAPSSTQGT